MNYQKLKNDKANKIQYYRVELFDFNFSYCVGINILNVQKKEKTKSRIE